MEHRSTDSHNHHHVHGELQHENIHGNNPKKQSNLRLAISATLHCLLGCGLGEILGVIIGTYFLFSNAATMILAVILGFVMGFVLGMWPLLKSGMPFNKAFKIILAAEGLSILVMETAEVLVEVYTPGVMDAGVKDGIFWLGMGLALIAGFLAAFPVNYIMIKRGVTHNH